MTAVVYLKLLCAVLLGRVSPLIRWAGIGPVKLAAEVQKASNDAQAQVSMAVTYQLQESRLSAC